MIDSNYRGNLTEGTEKSLLVMEVSSYRESTVNAANCICSFTRSITYENINSYTNSYI